MTRLRKNKKYFSKTSWTSKKIHEEIEAGLSLLNKTENKIVTFFGSHKTRKESHYYNHCRKVAYSLGKQGYAVISGGGPGIMQAANTGAMQAKAISIGLKADFLKGEKVDDDIFTHILTFHFMFVRRFILSIKSEALIFYPGGFGTLNELFEYAVLMQTGVVDKVPIILVDRQYWESLFKWLKAKPKKNNFFINTKKDLDLFYFADDLDEILDIIKKR